MAQPLIRNLPDVAIDIVGDIHGEIDALRDLLRHLGYDNQGWHPENRRLVFIGDFIDRGIDSPAVVETIRRLTDSGNALAILGNHELNLLNNDQKDGSGWFFEKQRIREQHRYVQYKIANEKEKCEIINYINTLPIALENNNLRIIHAAWLGNHIETIKNLGNIDAKTAFSNFRANAKQAEKYQAWYSQYIEEHEFYHQHHRDENFDMPYLRAIGQYDLYHGEANPMRALTCGTECFAKTPFYAAGRWRFVTRKRWWEEYNDDCPVIIGHYWRQWYANSHVQKSLFSEDANQWLGKKKNIFCVDFSIGALWKSRMNQAMISSQNCRLSALRLPEKILVFNNGETSATQGFKQT
ncbi:MAG: metallophosphoesterase [Neisseriaceae bacterium]|nr:metallophosphoesterase [Neisseriaceae bacterium]